MCLFRLRSVALGLRGQLAPRFQTEEVKKGEGNSTAMEGITTKWTIDCKKGRVRNYKRMRSGEDGLDGKLI